MHLDDVSAVHHDDGIVFVHLNHGLLFAANRIGAEIWNGLQQDRSATEIANEIAAAYNVPQPKVNEDVRAFVSALITHNLIPEWAAC